MHGPSEQKLFARWQAGDEEAMRAIVSAHLSSAWAVAIALVRDPDEAEDVCQEAFIRAWDKRRQCRDPAGLRGWLLAIVRSSALARLRRGGSRQTVAVPESLPSSAPSPERETDRTSLRAQLLRAMEGLSETQRQVLLLRDLEGWPHEDVASLLSISTTMSRRHLSDARKRMRVLLKELGVDGYPITR